MIDRGALVLARRGTGAYRGTRRTPLDGMAFTGRTGKQLGRRYTDAVVAGDGVMEDLDEALAVRDEARRLGLDVEAVVFEVPQTPFVPAGPGRLPLVDAPPAEGLELLGWDVIEPIEPWDSPLAGLPPPVAINVHGLLSTRDEAEVLAAALNAAGGSDEPWVTARIWAAPLRVPIGD